MSVTTMKFDFKSWEDMGDIYYDTTYKMVEVFFDKMNGKGIDFTIYFYDNERNEYATISFPEPLDREEVMYHFGKLRKLKEIVDSEEQN